MNEERIREKTLQEHLEIIVRACIQLCPALKSVILYGGFGRDEGSWFQDETGAWSPYNDYDICIVTDRKVPNHEMRALEKQLAEDIGINWIDLSQLSLGEMKRLRPSIKNYDFKNGSKIIHGDPAVLDLLPDIDVSSLPMKEAQILYFTRLYTLLGSLDGKGLDQDLEGDASRFFRNQMAKAVLAVVDVLLLAKGGYDASYRKRVDRVTELYLDKSGFLTLSRWALQEKLRPEAPKMNAQEVSEMYNLVQHQYTTEMYRSLSLRFGKRVTGPKDIEFCMKWLPTSLMKRLYWLLKFRGPRMEKQISVMLAQSYVAAAWTPDCINEKLLRRGTVLLRRVDNSILIGLTWDEARLAAVRLRMEV